MPKGQQRGNKEAKKPKKEQAPPPAIAPIAAAPRATASGTSRPLPKR